MLGEEFLRARLHESVATLLERILDEPTLIEIEDVHHMDDASADLLGYIADHLDGHPWLFCVSRRPGAKGFTHDVTPDSDDRRTRGALGRRRDAARVAPSPSCTRCHPTR